MSIEIVEAFDLARLARVQRRSSPGCDHKTSRRCAAKASRVDTPVPMARRSEVVRSAGPASDREPAPQLRHCRCSSCANSIRLFFLSDVTALGLTNQYGLLTISGANPSAGLPSVDQNGGACLASGGNTAFSDTTGAGTVGVSDYSAGPRLVRSGSSTAR